MKARYCILAATVQTALIIIASPVVRAQETTTDGYVTRKEYEELKAQMLAMKKELDTFKKERAVAPEQRNHERSRCSRQHGWVWSYHCR